VDVFALQEYSVSIVFNGG